MAPRIYRSRPLALEFDRSKHKHVGDFQANISAVAQAGDDLWLGSDELTSVERLSRKGPDRFGHHTVFNLADYVKLPAGGKEEVDVEGLAVDGGYLWIAGSHSLKRAKADPSKHPEDAIERLARMVRETNRFLLARIPLVKDPKTGRTTLHRDFSDPGHPKRRLSAAQLVGSGQSNSLVDALREDPHLGRFLSIPCKENGFDIEGLEAHGDRVFLGLRGPVLGGWAVVLEIEVEPVAPHLLGLKRIGTRGAVYRKHFLDLRGLGVRELCREGKDLLVLAGPTMALDGNVVVFRWKKALKAKKEQVVPRDDLKRVLRFRFHTDRKPGTNHAEGITLYEDGSDQRALLVTYDSPGPGKQHGATIEADVFPF